MVFMLALTGESSGCCNFDNWTALIGLSEGVSSIAPTRLKEDGLLPRIAPPLELFDKEVEVFFSLATDCPPNIEGSDASTPFTEGIFEPPNWGTRPLFDALGVGFPEGEDGRDSPMGKPIAASVVSS